MELPANIGITIKPTNVVVGKSMITYIDASTSESARNGITYLIVLTVFPILMKGNDDRFKHGPNDDDTEPRITRTIQPIKT